MSEPTVMTVRGPIPASELGTTLMHEHIFISQLRELRSDGLLNNFGLAVKELSHYRAAGGQTVVDVTPAGLWRQPLALRRVSEETGLHIVAGCCLYRHQYYDADWVDRHSTDQIADLTVAELTEGIDGTEVRAGIIGEIACDEYLTAQEERVFRAAARAHKRTGATITTHAARWPVGLTQLDLLAEEGVDPRRVIIGHCGTVSSPYWSSPSDVLDYHEAIARRGAFVQFDTVRSTNEYELQLHVDYVLSLVHRNCADRILLSHDIEVKSNLHAYGGVGYDCILVHFVPRLREAGLPEETVRQILVDNPRRALTGE